jgi:hypothetical protein
MTSNEECMKSLQQLIRVMQSIVVIYSSNNGGKGSDSILSYMKRYEKDLITSGKTTFKDHHAQMFVDMYHKYRQQFLDIVDENEFIGREKLRIWFGEEVPQVKKKNFRLPIGICYEKARKMYIEADSKITEEDDDRDADILMSPEYKMHFELLYFVLDNICNALECLDFPQDLPSLRKSLKHLRSETDIDENNEVPGSTFKNLAEKFSVLVTGKKQNFDEASFNDAIGKADEILSSPLMTETVPEMFGNMQNMQPTEGQTITEVMMGAVQRFGPTLEKIIPMSNEPVPEGVTIDNNVSNPVGSDDIEIIKKNKQ